MSEALFSPSWYRVAGLMPRLRSHVQIHRHDYRGQTWYILQDRSTEKYHRFSPAAYLFIGLMNGKRTIQELWDLATNRLGDDAPGQEEVVQLLSQLHAADAIQCDVPPDTAELLQRRERQQRRVWQKRLFSIFAWQFPLFDPERMLQAGVGLIRPFVSWWGAVLWLSLVAPAAILAVVHWSDLTKDVLDQIMAPQNLLVLWLLFPIIKVLHEFGHAFAVKVFGGEVHEMGVMLLVLTPVPYVDASGSSAFRSKWHRILVGGAGMGVELILASFAMFIWLSAEPGTVKVLAYNTILIAGISTLIFNANPLLRFDGYYMLADYLEIPNLRSRANQYLGYLCERYLFGRKDAQAPPSARGERPWFVTYSVTSFVYRIFVVAAILLFLTDQFLVLGLIFAILTGLTWVAFPIGKGLGYLLGSPRLRRVRPRALTVTAAVLAAVVGLVCLAPVPFRTRAEGVVWIPDEAFVRAAQDGFVRDVVAAPGSRVHVGDVLIVCQDPELEAEERLLAARLQEVLSRIRQKVPEDLVKAQILEEERKYYEESLRRTREKAAELTLRSRAEGTFVLPKVDDLPGHFVKHGELLGHVVELSTVTVRTIVGQTDIDLIRHETQGVDVRVAERLSETLPARVARLVPAASEELPSPALGSEGGGKVPMDPRDPKGQKAMRRMFQIDLQLPTDHRVLNVGGRVYVRFDHGWEPLAFQWYRDVRQLFLSRFNV
jgi:putative peptide zinc metalloprotease protein